MILSYHHLIHTPLKTFYLLEVDGALSALCAPDELPKVQQQIQRFPTGKVTFLKEATPLLLAAEQQLKEYFSAQRTEFDLPIKLYGTAHQQSVWKQLSAIPHGKTCTYGHIAHALGEKGAQAVGTAVGKNPLPIIVPCHRVLPANGALGQFSMQGGPAAKAFLLDLENAVYKH